MSFMAAVPGFVGGDFGAVRAHTPKSSDLASLIACLMEAVLSQSKHLRGKEKDFEKQSSGNCMSLLFM